MNAPIYKGEIYWCSLPHYSSSVLKKDRPCVVISNNKANEGSYTVQVCPITTNNKKENIPCHVKTRYGMVHLENVYTIDKEQVKDLKGRLNWQEMRQLDTSILIQFGII